MPKKQQPEEFESIAKLPEIFKQMIVERRNQLEKHGLQNHIPSLPKDGVVDVLKNGDNTLQIMPEEMCKAACDQSFAEGNPSWAAIAIEELAEAIDAPTEAARREELVQLATVCAAWIEMIDKQNEVDG